MLVNLYEEGASHFCKFLKLRYTPYEEAKADEAIGGLRKATRLK